MKRQILLFLILIGVFNGLPGQNADTVKTGTFTDSRDGHTYKWVKIGEQVWMAENLAFMPSASSSTGSETLPFYYVYGYEGTSIDDAKITANYITYGVLYNFEAAKIACPLGWHLPTDGEWKILEMDQGMSTYEADTAGWRSSGIVGGKLKESGFAHWKTPNIEACNSSSFNGLPGGTRYETNGFGLIGDIAAYWSSTGYNQSYALYRSMYYKHNGVGRYPNYRSCGLSVRCVKD